MDFAHSFEVAPNTVPTQAVVPATSASRSAKIVVAGSFGVGKTTFIGAVSEIKALRMEEPITQASAGIDTLAGVPGKTTTTVGIDFGRLQVTPDLVLYLFGLPGQNRFLGPFADSVLVGALGVLVLVDTRDLEASHPTLDLLDNGSLPFGVAVNRFDGAPAYPPAEIRQALALPGNTLLTTCDARERGSSLAALVTLLSHLAVRPQLSELHQ